MALCSFALFVMNFVIIIATTFVMFELKHVVPASMKPAGDLFTSAKDARAAVSRVTDAARTVGKGGARRRAATSPTSGGGGSYERLALPLAGERSVIDHFGDGGGGERAAIVRSGSRTSRTSGYTDADLASFPRDVALSPGTGGAAASMEGDIL